MRHMAWGLPLALLACTLQPTIEQRLSAYVGRSEGDLVAGLGVPLRTYEADGRKFLAFEERRTTTALLADPAWPRSFSGSLGASPYLVTRRCEITFVLRAGIAESFSLRGDGCY